MSKQKTKKTKTVDPFSYDNMLLFCKHVEALSKTGEPPGKPDEGIASIIQHFKDLGEDFSDAALEESLKTWYPA